MVGIYTYFPALIGCLSRKIAKETPPLLRIAIWVKTVKCSYPKLTVGANFLECDSNPLVSWSYPYFINIDG